MLKKMGKVLLIVLLVIVAVIGIFYIRYQSMASNVRHQYESIKPVDMSKIADGVYTSSFGDFLVSVKVNVIVKKHRIEQVKIVEQKCGPGYEALDTTNRIVKAQNSKVDAVTGASGSSMAIMIAVNRALIGK